MSNSTFDIYVMAAFGLAGYVMMKLNCEPAPFLLGMILGPLLEENLQRALMLSRGDLMVFVERPISASLLAVSVLSLLLVALPHVRRKREDALQD